MSARTRLAGLVAGRDVIDSVDSYSYEGATILVAGLGGDPESDGEDYYSDEVAVAWDASLDREGEAGACLVDASELATWLSLRWPCTIGGPGFARDGEWYRDGRDAVRS